MKFSLLAVLALVALGLSSCTVTVRNHRDDPYREPVHHDPEPPPHRGPVVVVNKLLRVPAHGWKAQLITVKTPHRVRIELVGAGGGTTVLKPKISVRAGDIIVRVGERSIENIYDYTYALEDLEVGEPVEIRVVRDGE